MPYLPLYRRLRPRNFFEVIAQEAVTQTLLNAVLNNRIASTYLFCGPRGTGKTTTARIFAKALNCLNPKQGEPCNDCQNCRNINSGNFLDIIEMDAASHTQVDTVRDFIIDKVNFVPVEGKYKIYIIDEVHKLSRSSFDALLKTLEEPPAHIVFILATTHPFELPPTILSRCQRYDFKRITYQTILRFLYQVCDREGFAIEEGALHLMAKNADGALRNALILLDQAVAYAGKEVSTADIIQFLGMTSEDILFQFSEHIYQQNTTGAIDLLEQLFAEGKDLEELAKDLLEHFRNLLLVKVTESPEILELPEELYARLLEHTRRYENAELMKIIKILITLKLELKDSVMGRFLWELALVQLTRFKSEVSLETLAGRVKKLEQGWQEAKMEESQEIKVMVEKAKEVPVKSSSEFEKKWENWFKTLHWIRKEKRNLHAILMDTQPLEFENHHLTLGLKKNFTFHKEWIDKEKHFIEGVLSQFYHFPVTLDCVFLEDGQTTLFKAEAQDVHQSMVNQARELFGGEIVSESQG